MDKLDCLIGVDNFVTWVLLIFCSSFKSDMQESGPSLVRLMLRLMEQGTRMSYKDGAFLSNVILNQSFLTTVQELNLNESRLISRQNLLYLYDTSFRAKLTVQKAIIVC